MMSGTKRLHAACLVAGSLLSVGLTSSAQADQISECIASFEQAQQAQNASLYLEARDHLRMCMEPSCGPLLMKDCTRTYEQVELSLPTVVLSATDTASNRDRTDVSVYLDGQLLTEKLDGAPISMNPGSHELRFVAKGVPEVTQTVLVRAGEKLRHVNVSLQPHPMGGALDGQEALGIGGESLSGEYDREEAANLRPYAFALGGIAVLGAGAFVGLRLMGASEFRDLDRTCAPNCTEEELAPVRSTYTWSQVALGAGIAAATGGVVLYLLESPGESTSETTLAIVPSVSGAAACVTGSF